MAAHIRRQVREAIGTALTGLTTTGSRVFQSRAYPLETTDVAGQHLERSARMNAALAEWARGIERDRLRPNPR